MKFLVVLCLVAVAAAAPPYNDVKVLRYENDNIGVGNYKYVYEQDDGSKQEKVGVLLNDGQNREAVGVKGSYSWNAPDGFKYIVTYVGDENGYRSSIEKVDLHSFVKSIVN